MGSQHGDAMVCACPVVMPSGASAVGGFGYRIEGASRVRAGAPSFYTGQAPDQCHAVESVNDGGQLVDFLFSANPIFKIGFFFFCFRARQRAREHMQVTALAGHIVNDPASRAGPSADHPTVLKRRSRGLGSPSLSAGPPSRRAASRSAPRPVNANEFPFCMLTSGVPLDVLAAPLATSTQRTLRPSKPSPTACVCAEKYSIRYLTRTAAVVPDHQQNGGRIWCRKA
jgi:hypothetical protein